MNTLTTPTAEYQLARFPRRKNDLLRAWDAADEYALSHLHEQSLLTQDVSILILNDSFGALSVALADHGPTMMSDSHLAQQGTLANLKENGRSEEDVRLLTSLEKPSGTFDVIVIKVPKILAYLEDQLHRIRPCLRTDTVILGAGMAKGIHTSTLKLFERILGPNKTSLAKKKARLIHCEPNLELSPGDSPYPTSYKLEGTDHQTTNHANVFSREKLDVGTRLLLASLETSDVPGRIVDLGCGNGVVGLKAAIQYPDAEVFFVDESFMAVASAETTVRAALGDRAKAQFRTMDCLAAIPARSIDLVLVNPPYHQERGVDDAVAWQMLRESKDVLAQGGELRMVGNRHLGYHVKLERVFGNCSVVGDSSKFVVLKAVKR
ncbi:MAG: methyltransferase [Candidatus Latescibacteria bacterium]|nr:methyltransferase [Candidatus Latescibacterota bacterium]